MAKKTIKKYGVEASKKLRNEVKKANKSTAAKKRIEAYKKLVLANKNEQEFSFSL